MEKHVHGTYDHISDTYEAVLHLIGSGWAKDDIMVVMTPTILVSDKLTGRRSRERRQKSLLESVFPLQQYSPEFFARLSEADKEMIRPYLPDLNEGRILLILRGAEDPPSSRH